MSAVKISASDVKKLRDMTGAGMMDCKKALTEAGGDFDKAIEILHFNPKHAAKEAEKVLRSAVSNLFNKDEESKHEPADLYVKEAFVNQGPSLKRLLPAPMERCGSSRTVHHGTNHQDSTVGQHTHLPDAV